MSVCNKCSISQEYFKRFDNPVFAEDVEKFYQPLDYLKYGSPEWNLRMFDQLLNMKNAGKDIGNVFVAEVWFFVGLTLTSGKAELQIFGLYQSDLSRPLITGSAAKPASIGS